METDQLPKPDPPEVLNPDGSYLNHLREELTIAAEQKSRDALESVVRKITNFSDSPLPSEIPSQMSDDTFRPSTLYVLREAGILEAVGAVEVGSITQAETADTTVMVDRFAATHFGMSFQRMDKLEEKKSAILEKFRSAPIAQSFFEAATAALQQNQPPETQTQFSPASDLLITASIFETVGVLRHTSRGIDYSPTFDLEKNLADMLEDAFQHAAQLDEKGDVQSVSFSLAPGITAELLPHQSPVAPNQALTENWTFQIHVDQSVYMKETANQSPHDQCEAFINRPTGSALIATLESSGLRCSPQFEQYLLLQNTDDFNDRFGGPYTQLSRVLAKVVWSGKVEKLSEVFVTAEGQPPSTSQLEELCASATDDAGLTAVFDILRQLLNRTDYSGDIEPTESDVKIQKDACFDVTSYYVQAEDLGKLYQRPLGEKPFLLKAHGGRTLINCVPFKFKGVELPRGCLFSIGQDGKLAFLRVTPFVFDAREDMISAFGTEVIKAEQNGNLDQVLSRVQRGY